MGKYKIETFDQVPGYNAYWLIQMTMCSKMTYAENQIFCCNFGRMCDVTFCDLIGDKSDLHNDLTPGRWQTIIFTDDDPILQRIYVSFNSRGIQENLYTWYAKSIGLGCRWGKHQHIQMFVSCSDFLHCTGPNLVTTVPPDNIALVCFEQKKVAWWLLG